MLGFIWIPSPIHLAVDGMGEARPILLSKFYLFSPRQIELISIFLRGLLLCACKLIKTFPFIRELFHAQKKKKRSFPLLLWDPTFCWTSGEGSVNPSCFAWWFFSLSRFGVAVNLFMFYQLFLSLGLQAGISSTTCCPGQWSLGKFLGIFELLAHAGNSGIGEMQLPLIPPFRLHLILWWFSSLYMAANIMRCTSSLINLELAPVAQETGTVDFVVFSC